MAAVTAFLMGAWWIPIIVIAPIAIVFLLAGIAAVAAPSSQRRADAYRVVEAILQIRFLAGGDRKKIDPDG